MATLLESESRRKYSWWWDSHIPKNSKWLQENLTDMDAKVKAMIKLIEEDADSFARRAEMYYKKRPELMKLVEEFYRAYRALAERYDHLTGELRHAQKAMQEAFPNHVPFLLDEDSPSRSSELDQDPQTPDVLHPRRANSAVSDVETRRRGLKFLQDMFEGQEIATEDNVRKTKTDEKEGQNLHAEMLQLSNENASLKAKVSMEFERVAKAESEIQKLQMALTDMKTERDSIFCQYQLYSEKLSNLEEELVHAQKDFMRLNDQAMQAEAEVQSLKEAHARAEVEKDAALIKHEKSMDEISNLQALVAHAQEDIDGLNRKVLKAETEAQNLNIKISHLENEISLAEEHAQVLKDQANQAESEVARLRKALTEVNQEKESSSLQYQHCLKRISELESELSCAQEEVKRLNIEISAAVTNLKHSENKCKLLEMSNQSLRLEAENLTKKIARKDKELSEKQEELGKLQICLPDEQLRYAQIEAMLQTLQTIHSQSQEEHKLLAEELKISLQTIKDLEVSKHDLEDELREVQGENTCLNELKLSSTISMENLQNEILCLRNMKEKLEEDVAQRITQSNSLHKEITTLKEEIEGLNSRYHALLDQLEAVGLKPDCIGSSVKKLLDENAKLKQLYENQSNEKETLYKKLENLEKLANNEHVLQSSLSELNVELETSREKVREMQEMCQFVRGEKSVLISEKATLLSQLQNLTENMQKLLEKNAVLENSLTGAKIELEGLREKSKGLEAICDLLKNEKSNLQAERSTLALQLANVERGLEYVQEKFTGLEVKYSNLEKEKQSMHSEMNELRISLGVEKQERTSSILQSESRLVGLEHDLHFLQVESRWRKKEFEDELEKAVKAQCEVFILQKFVEDMEQKNYSLLIECQKQAEASRLAEKLITELENENLEQQVEAELLLDEIEKLRLGIYRVFKALDVSSDSACEDKVENEQIFLQRITAKIEEMKHSLSNSKDDEQILSIENAVLLTILRQLKVEGAENKVQKDFLEKELKITNDKLMMVQSDKHKVTEINLSFESHISHQNEQIVRLKQEAESFHSKETEWQKSYLDLQVKYSQALEENRDLYRKFSELKEEKLMLEQKNDVLIQENLGLSKISTALENQVAEKSVELELLSKNLKHVSERKDECEKDAILLRMILEEKEAENLLLKDSVHRLEVELHHARQANNDLKQEIVMANDVLTQKEAEVLLVENKFKVAENLNLELGKTVDALKAENLEASYFRHSLEKQLLTLSVDNSSQDKEINNLRQVNENLVTELCKLHEECEEQRVREDKLSAELKARNNEFELWEDEATAFYFDLQLSSIHGVLYENKVHELANVCGSLEQDSASKNLTIEKMKENINLMENEIGGLKAQLSAYAPIVASLREDVASLEHNVLYQKKLIPADWSEPTWSDFGADPDESLHDKSIDGQSPKTFDVEELQNLQRRIKSVEKVMAEDTHRLVILKEKKDVKLRRSFSRRKSKLKEKKVASAKSFNDEDLKLVEDKAEGNNVKKIALMKDIPLDHVSESPVKGLQRKVVVKKGRSDDKMLEQWENTECRGLDRAASISRNLVIAADEGDIVYDHIENIRQKVEHPSTSSEVEKELEIDKQELSTGFKESDRQVNSRKILERLSSDAQKLTNLQLTVQNLRRKLDTSKDKRNTKNVDLETVKEQLQEVQETVVQLVDLNGQLMKNIEDNPSSSSQNSGEVKEAENVRKKKVAEQARKGSEKIGRLQLEVQKLQYVLLKMEDEQKSKSKSRFPGSKTTIILRDFIYSGRKDNAIKKKSKLCCFKPTTPNTPSPRMYYN